MGFGGPSVAGDGGIVGLALAAAEKAAGSQGGRRTVTDEPTHEEALRRVKHVQSRELPPAEAEAMWKPGSAGSAPGQTPFGVGEPVDVPLIVDPMRFGKRHRKRFQSLGYRLAEMGTFLCTVGTIAGVIVMALGDRLAGNILIGSALLCGLIAVAASARTRLAGRLLVYAMAATILAGLAAVVAVVVPESWF